MLIFLSVSANAQFIPSNSQFIPYRKFTFHDGLPSSQIYRVYSDKSGFIWISSSSGLTRYDGNKFHTFTIHDSLPDHEVFNIYDDKKGKIWFTTLRGIPGYVKNNKIFSYKAIPILIKEKVISVYPASNGDVWFGTFKGNLFQTRNDSILHVYGGINSRVVGMAEDEQNRLWYLTYEGNRIYVIEDNKSKEIIISQVDGHYHYSRQPLLLKNGNIAFYGLGFCGIIDKNTGEVHTIADKKVFGEDLVICLHEDEMENLWVGTNHGIYLLVKMTDGSYYLKRRFLHHIKASFISQDFEGNFWISSLGQGLYMIPYNPVYAISVKSNTSSNNISALTCDKNGRILIGVDDGNVLEFDGQNLHVIYQENEKYYIARVTAQLNHSNQSIWFLKDDGLIIVKPNKTYIRIKDFIFGKAIVESPGGYVWIGGSHALYQFNSTGEKIKEYRFGRINAVACDQQGNIWFSNEEGLNKLEGDKKILKYPASLFQNQWISDIQADTLRNIIWVSTFSNGVFLISEKRIIYHLNSKNGLSSDYINEIIQDSIGDIWLATKNGINYIHFDHHGYPELFHIGSEAGLVTEEVNRLMITDDIIYVGTSDGLSIIEKRNLRFRSVPPRIYISNIAIAEKEQAPASNYRISYTQSRLKIDVVGLSYHTNEPLIYKYIMEGLDSSWSYTNSPTIHYNSLLPGKYVFKVKAINQDGIQSEQAAVVNFEVSFAYWQTWWFRAFLLFIVLLVLFVSMVVRVRSIKKREEEKTRLTRLLGELELTALKAQMNPHFIFNSLGSIQNLINRDKKMEANIYLSKFARLLRMTLDYSDKREIPLADEINMLEHYLSLESLRFVNKFEYIIETAPGLDLYEVKIPPMLLQPFIENSIKHGLLPKKGEARLIVRFKRQNDGTLYCMVEDNGIGRVQREKLKEKSQMGHISKGIKITRNRLELLNQIRNKPAEIRITDLYHDTGEAAGTRVEVVIPIE
ncbi:MAG: histidine kinase [Flavobacteriales bacterium]|nr:histidine kinase [Flavobacteriales bacterium]